MSEAPNSGPAADEIPFGLLWGIKRSFLSYVRRMPDGQGSVHDGATPFGEDIILFSYDQAAAAPPAADGEQVWAFRGDVRFRGHAGMLFVRIASPVLTLRGNRAELTIDDPYDRPDAERVPLVTLDLNPGPAPDGAQVWLGGDVRLTEPGSVLFNDVYPPGELFEQLSVILPTGSTASS